ncbi:MAG: low temperature requirement protein A, partial [Acidimicrobiales bacterium]
MRGLPIPDREEDFTADPVELFFDLAFVFAFAELVSLLVHSPDWEGAAEFTLLFVLIW